MPEAVEITIENRLITDKRDINIYHHRGKSAHIISHHSSVTLPLRLVGEEDSLQVSVSRGAGNLWRHSLIDLPSWADFEFFSEGNVTVSHCGGRTILKIPPGPPTWELTLTRPNSGSPAVKLKKDNIAIRDQ